MLHTIMNARASLLVYSLSAISDTSIACPTQVTSATMHTLRYSNRTQENEELEDQDREADVEINIQWEPQISRARSHAVRGH